MSLNRSFQSSLTQKRRPPGDYRPPKDSGVRDSFIHSCVTTKTGKSFFPRTGFELLGCVANSAEAVKEQAGEKYASCRFEGPSSSFTVVYQSGVGLSCRIQASASGSVVLEMCFGTAKGLFRLGALLIIALLLSEYQPIVPPTKASLIGLCQGNVEYTSIDSSNRFRSIRPGSPFPCMGSLKFKPKALVETKFASLCRIQSVPK